VARQQCWHGMIDSNCVQHAVESGRCHELETLTPHGSHRMDLQETCCHMAFLQEKRT
jgi:hypothetical protein